MEQIGFDKEIIEDGTTFLENALIKAKTISEFIKDIIADEAKMAKFREIVADLKELSNDIKDVKNLFDKE